MNREEKIKKLKTRIKRNKITVVSWYDKSDMSSKIKNLDIDIVTVDNKEYFDIKIKQVEVMHKLHDVNHQFLYRPVYSAAEIKNCKFIKDGFYQVEHLINLNSYEMWTTHFRECIWSIAKALKNECMDNSI